MVPLPILAAAILVFGLTGTASAARPGKDGKIHACYRVKGKPKGALRVVPSARARCRRGERKVAWSAAGSSGFAGTGSQGAQGQGGAAGAAGDEAALRAQVGALSLKVQALEGLLQGVTSGDLSGVLGTLQGLDNEGLTSAVDSLPLVESLCEQNEELTKQINLVAEVVGGLGLSGVVGGLLVIPALPEPLAPVSCPAP